jgi:intracellular multiplication protein IcmD
MQAKQFSFLRKILKPLLWAATIVSAFFVESVFAAPGTSGLALSSIASNIDVSVKELSTVLSDISLIAGVGFVMASFFKFHQHKLNPTQVPLSQGITLLLIGAGLMLFPTMLPTAKRAVFGSQAQIAKIGGNQIHSIIGTK